MLFKNLGYQFSIWASDRKCLLAQKNISGQPFQHCSKITIKSTLEYYRRFTHTIEILLPLPPPKKKKKS
jgi:hypothetical protein